MASRLHRNCWSNPRIAARARQPPRLRTAPHRHANPDLPSLNAYLPELNPAALMLFDAKGNPVHPLRAALGDANPPGVVMAFFERVKAGEASEMTLDNFRPWPVACTTPSSYT